MRPFKFHWLMNCFFGRLCFAVTYQPIAYLVQSLALARCVDTKRTCRASIVIAFAMLSTIPVQSVCGLCKSERDLLIARKMEGFLVLTLRIYNLCRGVVGVLQLGHQLIIEMVNCKTLRLFSRFTSGHPLVSQRSKELCDQSVKLGGNNHHRYYEASWLFCFLVAI